MINWVREGKTDENTIALYYNSFWQTKIVNCCKLETIELNYFSHWQVCNHSAKNRSCWYDCDEKERVICYKGGKGGPVGLFFLAAPGIFTIKSLWAKHFDYPFLYQKLHGSAPPAPAPSQSVNPRPSLHVLLYYLLRGLLKRRARNVCNVVLDSCAKFHAF